MNSAGPTNQRTGGYGNTVPLTTGNVQQVPVINNPVGMRLAQAFTLLFSITSPPTLLTSPGAPAACNCIARINWVENGQQVQREVSVGPGTGVSITGFGTGVQVSFRDVPIGTGYVNGLKYQATALLAPGVRASQSQLPILQTLATFPIVASTSSGPIPIPENAGVRSVDVSAVETNAIGSPVLSNIYCIAQNPAGGVLKIWNPNVETGMVPLPPSATAIVIQNNDNAHDVQVTVLWGVDG